MMSKALSVFLLLASVQCIYGFNNETIDVECPQVQDEPRTNLVFIHPDTEISLKARYGLVRTYCTDVEYLAFRGVACECEHFACQCRVGLDAPWLRETKGCITTNYIPENETIEVTMKFNETEVLSRIVPVRDLKPGVALCANIPFAKDVKACITNPRFQIIKNNLRACISLSIEKLNTKYSVVAFRCFEMGPGKLPESVPALTDILNLPSSKENNQTELNHHENPKSKDE